MEEAEEVNTSELRASGTRTGCRDRSDICSVLQYFNISD